MDGITNNNQYSQRLCDERHAEINRRVSDMEEAAKGMKNWLIGVLVGVIFNLMGVLGLLLVQFGE